MTISGAVFRGRLRGSAMCAACMGAFTEGQRHLAG